MCGAPACVPAITNNCQPDMQMNGTLVVSIYADFHWLTVQDVTSTYICSYI